MVDTGNGIELVQTRVDGFVHDRYFIKWAQLQLQPGVLLKIEDLCTILFSF